MEFFSPCSPSPSLFKFLLFFSGSLIPQITHFWVTLSTPTLGARCTLVWTTDETRLLLWSPKYFLSSQTFGAKHWGHLLREPFSNLEFTHVPPQTSYVYVAIFKLYTHKTLGKNTNQMDSKPNWLKSTCLKKEHWTSVNTLICSL